MALLDMMRQIMPPRKGNLIALTVDHGLRKESLAEARAVAAWCAKHKILHHVLKWRGAKPKTGLHETARAARYELLENWCRKHHVLHLATAHHADDQAETILQRIAKASGPAGLAGMAEHSFTPHLHLWRPLLGMKKSELVDYCDRNRIPFARDASNENPKYARGRLRASARALAAEGMTAETLNLLANKQHEMVRLWERETAKFLAQHAFIIPQQRAEISLSAFRAALPAVQQMAMDYLLKLTSGKFTPIRHDSLAALCAALAEEFKAKTLGHCRIMPKKIGKKPHLVIQPEKSKT